MTINWSEKKILITGGTGSFGQAFTRYALQHLKPKVIRIFSRDELKQAEMKEKFDDPRLRYFIGNVQDSERLQRAIRGVDIIIHAAAMKRIEVCEYNPFEAVKTNIIGTQNVINQAIDCGVERLISISTDKAANPINLYGATKLCQEKITVQSNSYVGPKQNRLACVRYGNVVGSRGSVVQVFQAQKDSGEVTLTDDRMTRFWITLDQACRFVQHSIEIMMGGEIFVPKIPSMKVTDLIKAICPDSKIKIVGIRPGEKLHEVMITEDEARQTVEMDDRFVILPSFPWWGGKKNYQGSPPKEGFRYTSENNSEWLKVEDLRKLIDESNL
ncbi:MAG: UDP-N-acetylglucosamine 4,6-dehydratase (inverting) [Bradymonadales bacterium]|nr:MAG: UDP-N-acetylglucosamine 4,6-dehydratase (inverting) [Bradymonadales bacterium]